MYLFLKGRDSVLFIISVALVVLLVISPYVVTVWKRYKMLRRLTAVAAKNGFRIRRLRKLVCFSLNRAKKYDILFENKSCAYAVKLWSATKKDSTLVIKANGSIFLSSMSASPLYVDGTAKERRKNSRITSVPVTQNNFRVRKGKPVVNVLLYYPPYKEVVLDLGKSKRRVESGDRLFDKVFCVPAYFEKILCENAVDAAKTEALAPKESGVPNFTEKS